MPRKKPKFLYLASIGKCGCVKFGVSSNVEKRLSQLRYQCNTKISTLHRIWHRPNDAFVIEAMAVRKLSPLTLLPEDREWVNCTPLVVEQVIDQAIEEKNWLDRVPKRGNMSCRVAYELKRLGFNIEEARLKFTPPIPRSTISKYRDIFEPPSIGDVAEDLT